MAEKIKTTSFEKSNESACMYEVKDLLIETLDILEARYDKDALTGIPSGIKRLDLITNGFQKQEMTILGSRPSIGKTAMALSMIQHIAVEKQIPCGFFSLEMSSKMISQRLLSQVSRVSGAKFCTGLFNMRNFKKLQNAASLIHKAPLYIVDQPNMELLDMLTIARRLVVERNVKIIFIDHIGLIEIENKSASVYETQSMVSKSLRVLARELDIPIVVLCQLARSVEGEQPNLSQLRDSGSIEQDADVVILLHRGRSKKHKLTQNAKLIVAKNRNGATGYMDIVYFPDYTKFEDNAIEDGDKKAFMAHKLMVCGSRTITAEKFIFSKLDEYLALYNDLVILSGGARGVDCIGEKWASLHNVAVERFLPDWKKYGRGAGFVRNKQMAEVADYAMIFWDGTSKGTKSVIYFCKKMQKQFKVYENS